MKIISITTIKNESDIIESFVRYHLNIMDLMIILDNGSTDDTLDILIQLKNEGLPIVVIIDEDKYFEPYIKYNYLLDVALNEYSADIICPLDCDEFIICDEGNPRVVIEKILNNEYYKLKWKTFVPTKTDDENIKFVPSRITHVRDENIETNYKVIITKELVNDYNIKFSIGNHDIDVEREHKNKIRCVQNTNLNIAHFPLRSINQTKSKVLLGYPNTLSRSNVVKGTSFHYEVMFNKIKTNENLSMEDVTVLAKQYSLDFNEIPSRYQDDNLIELKKSPVDLSFCENLDIRYPFKESPISNLLNNYIYFAKEINIFKNKLDKSQKEYANIKDLNEKLEVYGDRLKQENKMLNDEKDEMKNNMNQINERLEEIMERNVILTKTKTRLWEDINELELINSKQQEEITQLKNKTLKDYIKDKFGK